MKNAIVTFIALLCIVGLAACSLFQGSAPADDAKITVSLVAPANKFIEDFNTNLYKLWLEEQTGLNIVMTWLPAEDAEQIVRQQLSSGEGLPDAYVGFGDMQFLRNPNIQTYGKQGVIIALNDYIEEYGVNTKALYEELAEHNIEAGMTSADGNIYFMPGFSSSIITRYRQIMWVNLGWLDALGLHTPETTEEFAQMLRAFKAAYPDAIPMAGTDAHYGKQAYDWIFNAFIYNDVNNSRLLLEDGIIGFAPIRDEWRDALMYLSGLYRDGLYSPLSFTQDDQQFRQMANDQRDILGAFMSPGITTAVLQNSPEVMERYIGIGPIMGPDGVKLSTVFVPQPKPSGVITKACQHPEEVFKLFDLMLSEEASLMGRYGTKGVDWDFAEDGEYSIYGTPATIRIINQLWNTTQNKHLMQIVPYVSRPKFSGGVTWAGDSIDGEYMNAQASLLYKDHEPKEFVGFLRFSPEEETLISDIRTNIEDYVKEAIVDFITGELDVFSDADWQQYIDGFDDLGFALFLETAQAAYNRTAQ